MGTDPMEYDEPRSVEDLVAAHHPKTGSGYEEPTPRGPSVRVEYGIQNADGTGTWAVPDYVAKRPAESIQAWAERVAEAEGGTVVVRTITVTDWSPAADSAGQGQS